MDVCIGTTPVVGLPQKLSLAGNGKRTLFIVPSTSTNSILLSDEEQICSKELPDIIFDIIWCYNTQENVIVIGSEHGEHVYFIDVRNLEVKQALHLLREQDKAWSRFAILVTPDKKRVVIISELVFIILKWSGDIIMDQRIMLSDSFRSLDNRNITFYDESNNKYFKYQFL
jgi:hypothetical protein